MVSRRTYTDDEKAAALALYETDGPRAVEAQLGVPKATVVGWANAANVRTRSTQTKADRVHASMLTMAQRKVALAEGLMDDIERLRTQLWARTVRKEVVTVSDGRSDGSHVEIVEVKMNQPTFADQRAIMTSLAIAVDKVQILTGDVTGRTELVGSVGRDALAARAAELDELAQRRAERGAA